MEDVNLLLSFIETEVIDGKKSFMSNGVVINGDNVLNLVKRIRASVNEMDGTNLIEEANEKAKKIVALAEQRKEQMLDESIVIREANAIAEKITSEAVARRTQIEESMKRNIVAMLADVKNVLQSAESEIDKTIKEILNKNG